MALTASQFIINNNINTNAKSYVYFCKEYMAGGGGGGHVKTFGTEQTRVMNCLHGARLITVTSQNFMKPERSIHARKSPPLVRILTQLYVVHTFPSYSRNTCFITQCNEYNI
jgi:hypothetical protein